MENNYYSLLETFPFKDFINNFSKITDEIINNNNFNIKLEEKDFNMFLKIIKNYGFDIIYNLNYISKNNNLNYLISNKNMDEYNYKNFFKNQIILIFIFLYNNHNRKTSFKNYNNDNHKIEQQFKKLYNNLYSIILKFYSSLNKNKIEQILDINDLVEIFRFNICLSLKDLLTKNYIFNLSMIYLVKFFTEYNNFINDLKPFYLLFEQLYSKLLNNKINLRLLRRNKNLDNFSIFKLIKITCSTSCDSILKGLIFKILDLIYHKNYSKSLSNIILNNIKENFYELKKDYNKNKIINCIKHLSGQTEFIDNIFTKEEYEKKDEYMPSTYFVFDGSKDSGINYNPNGELIKKNFTLIFSFKIERTENNVLFPLITFIADNEKKDIIFSISTLNNKLFILSQGDIKMNLIEDISDNVSYLVIVEFFKSMLNDKFKININGKKKEISSCNINCKSKSSLKIGYIPSEILIHNNIFNNFSKNISHFNGIMGPIIFFNNILDEKDFAINLLKLKGRYDSILFLNHESNFVYYFYYEEYKLYYDTEFITAQEYFIKLSKKIDEECLFTICPLSMFNSIFKKTNFFTEDIYRKNNKDKINNKELFPNFNTLHLYSTKTTATYAKKNRKSISLFVEYDGINIYTLIIEYFYNLLKMLINEAKEEKIEIANEINNVLCHVLNSITQIIIFFKIDSFSNDLDTFGFSLKKLFCLLIDIHPFNIKLIETLKISIPKLLDYYKKTDIETTGKVILDFSHKLFTLICSSDYYDMSMYRNCENIFRFFGLVINNNENLINPDIMDGLLSFSFVLNTISLDKRNNKPNGYTFKKNIEYKQMKKEYKNLIINFIKKCDSFQLYTKFIEKVIQKNISILEKYKLIKIYYENHNFETILDNYISEMKENEANKSIFNIFKKDKINDKKNTYTEEDLLNEYQKSLSKLINISSLIDSKNEKPLELLKSVFILLIYEHHLIIRSKFTNNKESLTLSNSNSSSSISLEKISFFSYSALAKLIGKAKNLHTSSTSILNLSPSVSKNEKSEEIENMDELILDFSSEENSQSFDKNELYKNNNTSNNINNVKETYMLEILLKSPSFSFYIIKAIFSCLCDQWNKNIKLKFIKSMNETYESFDLCFGEFNIFKKGLFIQYIKLIEALVDENVLEKSLKFIFSFMKQSINMYKTNQKNIFAKSIFLHLFESKSIINNFFDICINNENLTKNQFKNYIISSIKEINNNILSYHPRPFIFSFIKKYIKNINSQIIQIIKNILDYIINNIKLGNSIDKSINNYLYFNIIRFIKTLLNIFEKNPIESQSLLMNDNFKIFLTLQNLVSEFTKNDIIYDPNIYTFNPVCFIETNKINEKKELKFLQSQETKILNHKIIYLNICELSFNSIFIIWTSKNKKETEAEKYAIDYISKLYEEISFGGHFISYYFDLLNQYIIFHNKKAKIIPDNISNLINNEISLNYKHYINGNPPVRDSRIISVLLFLIILKYKSLLINYEKMKNYEKEEEFNSRKEIIKKLFSKYISSIQNDISFITSNLHKIKEDKKFEIILDKEESKSKIFKEFNKNYYKYILDIIIKNKNFNIDNIKEEIKNKYIKDENEQNRMNISFLKSTNINENNNITGQIINNNKKEKIRKSSYGFYNEYKEINENLRNSNKKKSSKNLINEINDNSDTKNVKRKKQRELLLLDFENSKFPILCTKRDLVFTKFGYFYYKEFFKDNKFMKMKKYFFYLNKPENENNCFNGFQKLMKNKCPFTIKNFSNHSLYYPRLFYRPYTKFFENKYLSVSHEYFKEGIINDKDEKIFHLEYGHGLLNQTNFNLFKLNINDDEDYSNKYDESSNIRLNNSNGEKIESKNTFNNEEFENKLKLYEKNKYMKSLHISNKNLLPFTITLKEDSISKKSNIRSKAKKKTTKHKLTLNPNNNFGINIFNSSKSENQDKHKLFFECELISPKNASHGILFLNKNFLIYQVDTKFDTKKYDNDEKYLISSSLSDLDQTEKQLIIPYCIIFQIIYRKFLFFNQACEFFLYNGKSYFFNFYKEENKNEFIKELKEIIKVKKIEKLEIIEDSIEYFNKNKYLNLWLEGKKTTLDYLLLINKFSNRSYNVLSQYLILPWTLTDYNEIYNPDNYRNMALPMPVQTENGLETIKTSYEIQPDNEYKCYFPMIYSTSMYVNNYLLRIYPFTNNQIKCQGGKFEEPGRQYDSIEDLCNLFREICHATMELVPEYYFIPEIFMNLNCCFFGKIIRKNRNILINNMKLGDGFKSILELINFHQSNINSDNISTQINKWIDNIFGENQITDKKNVYNSYPRECYEKYVKEEISQKLNELDMQKEKTSHLRRSSSISVTTDYLNKNNILTNNDIRPASKKQIISDIKVLITKTYFYGQCPSQLFSKSHPSFNKKQESKMYSLSNLDNIQTALKNDCIKIQDKELLYINESSNGNYFFILSEHQILVYNKLLKYMSNLSINTFCSIQAPFCFNYNCNIKNTLKVQYMYKYLIFEILECKYFFVAGYLDNSFRIYSKEKEKNIMYSIYTESEVTCIRSISSSSIFFTGHKNGKIVKWSYSIINKDNLKKDNNKMTIKVYKKNAIYAHSSFIKIIEINEKLGIIISAGGDGLIFIRKYFDFELLGFIKLNKYKKEIIDINLHKQIIILSVFKPKKKIFFIYTYSLNGTKLGKMNDQVKVPISILQESDDIFVFGTFNMYLVKITLKEKISLISITNDLNPCYYEGEKEERSEENEENDNDTFNEDFAKSAPISYFYDEKYHVLFCLFENGKLHRVNLIKNM